MKRFIKPLLAVVVAAGIAGVVVSRGCTRALSPVAGRSDMVEATTDPELAAAVLRARKELPRFIRALQRPAPDQRQFAINARMKTPLGFEQIWVTVHAYTGGAFEGVLAEEPYAIPEMHKGDAVRVPEADVSDWTFMNAGKIAGGYTMQVLLRREAEKANR